MPNAATHVQIGTTLSLASHQDQGRAWMRHVTEILPRRSALRLIREAREWFLALALGTFAVK
jgi:hypothetical protein